jgi:hypothetical protein
MGQQARVFESKRHELHTTSIEIVTGPSARVGVEPVETTDDITNRYCADLSNNKMAKHASAIDYATNARLKAWHRDQGCISPDP